MAAKLVKEQEISVTVRVPSSLWLAFKRTCLDNGEKLAVGARKALEEYVDKRKKAA